MRCRRLNTCTSTVNLNHHHQIQTIKSQQYRFKSFQSTPSLYKEEATSASSTESKPEEDDPCPDWQNPLHHNNPEHEKVFFEDFAEGESPEILPLPPFDQGDGKVVAAPHLHELADEVLTLNMHEMKELVDRIADHFDIEEGEDDMLVGGAVAGADAVEEEVVEKTAFDLKLAAFDAKSKIKVIKEVRAITGLGLKEAKAMVEGAPKVVKKDIKMEEAEELKAKLEAVGATVEIE